MIGRGLLFVPGTVRKSDYCARMKSFTLSLALSFALLPLAGCAVGGASQAASMLAMHDEHPVQVAALVVDMDTGETLLARDAQRLFRPASTQKLLATSAICRRDPDGEFVTSLSTSALPEGTVTLIACGDPMLSTTEVRGMTRELRSRGLTKATTEVRVVDALRDAPRFGEGWMWDDEPDSFSPVLSAACIDGGCVTVEATRGNGKPTVRLVPVSGELRVQVQTQEGDLQTTRGRYQQPNLVTITGRVPEDLVVRQRITVPDAARYTGYILADALRRDGALAGKPSVIVTTRAPGTSQRKGEVQLRRSVADVVTHTNKVSDNLGAEMLLRRLGTLDTASTPLSLDSYRFGVAAITADLQQLGFGASQFRIADGSGVSHYNLVSADLLVRLLLDMHQRGGRSYELFRDSLPIAGVDGTLASRMKNSPAAHRVRAKTGTVSAVSNLAGYIETRSGRRLAFAILCQNFVGSPKPWRDLQDRVCAALANM
ncbi:MAG: D-alanyl-D-alanine carboxypeptidase/D-alanyl-D-alanine-endopeptidase (penicillin-binding protein 4) [Planctomycetota bacterium]|jgi:D-alanyl-D-alanine carboxypeptidase/D-alanyl-D-alanine-endopeptidase (penicillin-binding protein 4)